MALHHINIINILGIQDLPAERARAMVEAAADVIQWRVIFTALDMLDVERRREAYVLFEDADAETLFGYMSEHVPQINDLITEETERYKRQLEEVRNDIDRGEA